MEIRRLLLLAIWLLAACPSHGQLVVGKPEWGFDGKVQGSSFTVLSVEVRNTGANAFEGEISLDDRRFGRDSGAPYKKSVFLAPGTAQIVQFFPYLPTYSSDWRLSWKAQRNDEVSLGEIKYGPPAVVFFADPLSPTLRGVRLPVFNEATFPPTVSATDGLYAVVLDHQPRLEAPRRDAFLDWLKLGGIVHIVLGADGVMPQFTDEYAVLNIPGERANVGLGTIVKHPVPRTEVSMDFLNKAGFYQPSAGNERQGYTARIDDQIFRGMSDATRPNIAWGWIYVLTGVYVVLIGPVFYIFRKRDYKLVLLGFLGTVAVFAWIFTVVGRRGYGEKQLYHQLAIAQCIGGDRWDVQHWVHPFATSGNTYRFSYPGPSQLFAAEGDSVRGEVTQGRDGNRQFTADIPLFSSRPFVHRGVLAGFNSGLAIAEVKLSNDKIQLQKLRLKAGPELTKKLKYAVAQFGSYYYRLSQDGDGFTLANPGELRNSLDFIIGQKEDYNQYGRYYGSERSGIDPEIQIAGFAPSLFRQIDGSNDAGARVFPKPAKGSVRVLIFAQSPPQFELSPGDPGKDFAPGVSLALFAQDLLLPATPQP